MRILHLHSGNLFGGIERFLLTCAENQASTNALTMDFALCFESDLAHQLRQSSAQVFLLGEVRMSRPWSVLAARQRLKAVLHGHKYQAVIFHGSWSFSLFAGIAEKYGVPTVFFAHDALRGDSLVDKFARRYSPTLALSNSRYTETFTKLFFPKSLSKVLYLPAQPPKNDYRQEPLHSLNKATIRQALHTSNEAVVILQFCRMEPYKGADLLISALAKMQDVSNWVFWLAGGASRPHEEVYYAALKKQVEDLGLKPRVHFLGARKDIQEVIAAADIHCQPNRSPEPFGLSFIEAMYAELPVVTFAMGGPLEIVDSTNGFIVEPGDMTKLEHALRTLVAKPELRRTLGKQGALKADAMCNCAAQLKAMANLLTTTLSSKVN